MKCKEPNIPNQIFSIKSTKPNPPNQFYQIKSRGIKFTENWSKVQPQLVLSLVQLSPSLFHYSIHEDFFICFQLVRVEISRPVFLVKKLLVRWENHNNCNVPSGGFWHLDYSWKFPAIFIRLIIIHGDSWQLAFLLSNTTENLGKILTKHLLHRFRTFLTMNDRLFPASLCVL